MLDVLADTYKIASRTDAWEAPRIDLTKRTATPVRAPNLRRRNPRLHKSGVTMFGKIAAWLRHRGERSRARATALRMSDHQLKDIGMSREDLLYGIDNG